MTTATPEIVIPDSAYPYPTADDIIAAFRSSGLKPTRGGFFQWSRPTSGLELQRTGACALGALAYQRAGEYELSRRGLVSVMRGLSETWQQGVVDGFDGNRMPMPSFSLATCADYLIGRATGQAVARWAFGEDA